MGSGAVDSENINMADLNNGQGTIRPSKNALLYIE